MIQVFSLFTLILAFVITTGGVDSFPMKLTRRGLLLAGTTTASTVLPISSALASPRASPRVKGAAELDAEYYMKNLLNSNKKGQPPSSVSGFASSSSSKPSINPSCRDPSDGFELQVRASYRRLFIVNNKFLLVRSSRRPTCQL